ncbi:MAG: integration host factor subunit beta [Spirochaetaceae bacterium]|jgi:integration host factor subunit beta|nr:integration host factor subunit beta [Spirochaetaceae bacterium]
MAVGKLTKIELVDAVWQKVGLEKRDIKCCYDEIINVIKEALAGRRLVELRGFGTFEVKHRKGKANARNPRTGELVPSHPHGVCVFKPGHDLKRSVWQQDEPETTPPETPDSKTPASKTKGSPS